MGLWCAWPQASVGVATFATFLISAILHELLFSVAFKTFKAWFFLGMLMQIPLIFISRFFKGKRRGNFLVWLSLFASQPLLEVCSNLNHGAWRWWVRLVEAADVMTDGCRYCTSELGTKPMTTSSVCPRKKACSTTTLTALAQPVLVRDALRYQAYDIATAALAAASMCAARSCLQASLAASRRTEHQSRFLQTAIACTRRFW